MHDLDTARAILRPVEQPIIDSYLAAAARYAALDPGIALALDPPGRAKVIHCLLIQEVEQRVDQIAQVTAKPTESLDFFALCVENSILLRFKYVGRGMPSNYPTPQQRLLRRQRYNERMMDRLSLDGIDEPPTVLTAGYSLIGNEIDRIEIRRDCLPLLPWSYTIYGEDSIIEPLTIPGTPAPALPAVVKSDKQAMPNRQRTKDTG